MSVVYTIVCILFLFLFWFNLLFIQRRRRLRLFICFLIWKVLRLFGCKFRIRVNINRSIFLHSLFEFFFIIFIIPKFFIQDILSVRVHLSHLFFWFFCISFFFRIFSFFFLLIFRKIKEVSMEVISHRKAISR